MRKKSLECVYELAKRDPRIVYIGSDVGAETLEQFKKEMPDRFLWKVSLKPTLSVWLLD